MSELNIAEMRLEKFDYCDITSLIELSNSVGWDYDQNEIMTILSSGRVYGHKTNNGKIVSCAAIIEYNSILASIGMVIVHEEYRGLGLGRITTQKCLESISRSTTAMLIATEAGKPMYKKMGFTEIDRIHKFLCDSYQPNETIRNITCEINSFGEEDLSQIVDLDQAAFGANRSTFLINRIKQSNEALTVKSSEGKIIGYGLSILGPVNLILGPIVAPDPQTAFSLVDKLAKNHSGKLRIDVPSENKLFISLLEKCGFSKVSQPPIMVKNSDVLPERNNTLYGIAAQIFG
ncbi:GNAT family N-acetyltransferase [Heyndrickxia sp. NPDC080065]|uniref:GNAT family N-acetyltransferase n=1 Tax=Heyndrickxia sp. NPDC080065 TaxID=3390568 RepID=UPI003D06BBF8